MATKEEDVASILNSDVQLITILTGGIYTDEEVGIQGFRRGVDSPTNNAFDVKGELKPCAVVRESGENPLPGIRSIKDKISGVSQPIEIYFYQHRGRDEISQAVQRSYEILLDIRLPGTYPLMWIGTSPVYYDTGPIANSTAIRQEWRCVFLKRPL